MGKNDQIVILFLSYDTCQMKSNDEVFLLLFKY